MKPKLRFNFNTQREYSEYKGYPPHQKEPDFHVNEHFIVPWELVRDKSKGVVEYK